MTQCYFSASNFVFRIVRRFRKYILSREKLDKQKVIDIFGEIVLEVRGPITLLTLKRYRKSMITQQEMKIYNFSGKI